MRKARSDRGVHATRGGTVRVSVEGALEDGDARCKVF